jgi:hypothetical protein
MRQHIRDRLHHIKIHSETLDTCKLCTRAAWAASPEVTCWSCVSSSATRSSSAANLALTPSSACTCAHACCSCCSISLLTRWQKFLKVSTIAKPPSTFHRSWGFRICTWILLSRKANSSLRLSYSSDTLASRSWSCSFSSCHTFPHVSAIANSWSMFHSMLTLANVILHNNINTTMVYM